MAIENPPPPLPLPSSTTSMVSLETIQKAVKALLKWKNSKSKTQKPQLLEQDEFMYLVLTLKKIPPKGRTNPYKISLKNPLHDPSSELCLIIDDRPKSKLTSDDAKKKIKSEDIPITKVIKLSKLRSDYRPFEAKRKLCDSYDMFFADKRVIPLLPKLLGKQFFKKKKIPVPIDLTHKNWKEQIDKTCSSALLYLRTGTCSVVRVGKGSMEAYGIVENVVSAIDGVVELLPKNWAGVRSFHLKFSESLALPIYQTLPDMKLKIEGLKKNVEKIEEGEEEEGGDLGVKDEKLSKKKGSKKGRIHEVRYMDTDVGEEELGVDVEDGGDDNEVENDEDDELGSANLGKKKRKKGHLSKSQVLGELNGKRENKMRKVDEKDGEKSSEKKRKKKSELGMELKDDAVKAKFKKSKKKQLAE